MTLATDQKLDQQGLSATSRSLLSLREEVLNQWQCMVRKQIPGARDIANPVLINTLPAFYDNLAEAVTASCPRETATGHTNAATAHGSERARMTSFSPDQVIQEYQLFKAAVLHVSSAHGVRLTAAERQAVEQSIDDAIREAIKEFTTMHLAMRERMAAGLSHDMRSPLAFIASAAQLIGLSTDIDTARRVALKIEANVRRLEQMMEEMLDALTFERSEKLSLPLSQFDMLKLAHDVGQEFDGMHPGTVEVRGTPVTGHWCFNAMRRALENLVVNAVKYGDGKLIRIHVDHGRNRVMLSVHNTGKPIAPELHGRIFEYLHREVKSPAAGWGIGLPFVRDVAEGHGGSVTVDSSSARGTTFLIDVPVDCRPFASA